MPRVTRPQLHVPSIASTNDAWQDAGDDRRHRAHPRLARGTLVALAVATVVLHVAANVWSPYGIHRDELLYLAMGRHLRLWAMDFFVCDGARQSLQQVWPSLAGRN